MQLSFAVFPAATSPDILASIAYIYFLKIVSSVVIIWPSERAYQQHIVHKPLHTHIFFFISQYVIIPHEKFAWPNPAVLLN